MWVTNSIRKYLEADKLEQFSTKKTIKPEALFYPQLGMLIQLFKSLTYFMVIWERREGKQILNFHQYFIQTFARILKAISDNLKIQTNCCWEIRVNAEIILAIMRSVYACLHV